MPRLKDLTSGAVSGTGTVNLTKGSRTFGGVMLSTDGTNLGTVVIRKESVSGEKILEFSSISSIFIPAPFDASDTIYYSITGTSVTAQLFEWAPYRGSRD